MFAQFAVMPGIERFRPAAVNRLVELAKPIDFMVHQGRPCAHSGPGTAYHLFYSLLARYLEEHLPAGPFTLLMSTKWI